MQAFEYPTLIHCEATRIGDQRNIRYDILVALQVREWLSIDQAISQVLEEAGYAFMYSGLAHPLDRYLAQSPNHYGTAMSLCQQLSDEQPIVCQKVAVLGGDSQEYSALCYVDIEKHTTPQPEKLDGQAFWERAWINPALKELLFKCNQLDPEDNNQTAPVRTYLIVDATRYIEHRGVFDLDIISDCPVMCMFTGESAETLKLAAPYLIDVTLAPQAYQDDSRVPHFHRRYFDTLWENNIGIFIQSSASMEQVHRHFRKFLKFNIEGANNRFFRFWDPRVLKIHLEGLSNYHKASHHFFNVPPDPRGNQQLSPVTFIYEDHRDVIDDEGKHQLVTTSKVANFNTQNYAQMQQRIKVDGESANPVANIPLMEIIDKEFVEQKRKQFCDKTAIWLIDNYGHKKIQNMTSSEFLFKQLAPLKNKFYLTLEYEVKYALAGCYLLESDIENIDSSYLQHLNFFQHSPAQRAENFLLAILSQVSHQMTDNQMLENKDVT